MMITRMTDMIGNTPLLDLQRLTAKMGVNARVLAKLERQNPAGSAKDRAALFMIEDAEKKGLLQKGGTIIEPTSGNTGIALAAIAATRGYRAVFVMPDTMSVERQMLLKAYGAEVVLTRGALGMQGSIDKAEEIRRNTPGSVIAGQFENPMNPMAHEATTGPEIWRDAEGQVDGLVAGIGTGGVITGTARYLKKMNPGLHVLGVEPEKSPLLTRGISGAHGLMGIGANFVPKTLDLTLIDEIMTETEENAYDFARKMAQLEGILVGISSGAALHAAYRLASRPEFEGKTIAVVLVDSGERYLSTPLYRE